MSNHHGNSSFYNDISINEYVGHIFEIQDELDIEKLHLGEHLIEMADFKRALKVILFICNVISCNFTSPQGLMNLALLSSNANQLRGALLELETPFRTGLVVLLALSIILQVMVIRTGLVVLLDLSYPTPPCSGGAFATTAL